MSHFPSFLFTMTTLDKHVGYFIFRMKPTFKSLSTSSLTILFFSSSFFYLFLCITTFDDELGESWWHTISRLIPGISDGFHVKRSMLYINIFMISASSSWDIPEHICVIWKFSAPICTYFNSPIGFKLSSVGSPRRSRSTKFTFTMFYVIGRIYWVFFLNLKLSL